MEDSSKLGGGFEFVLDESLVVTVSRYLKVASTLFDVPFFFFFNSHESINRFYLDDDDKIRVCQCVKSNEIQGVTWSFRFFPSPRRAELVATICRMKDI